MNAPATFIPGGAAADRAVCDQEAIHIPGSIQPHGLLFALRPADLTIVAVSENIGAVLGLDPRALLGTDLARLLDATSLQAVHEAAALGSASLPHLLQVVMAGQEMPPLSAKVSASVGLVLLELILLRRDASLGSAQLFDKFDRLSRMLQKPGDVTSVCQRLAAGVRELTGHDRVIIYRLERDGSGQVITEVKNDLMPSHFGLHFPASDIPVQARALYLRNPERQIPDARYVPVPLVSAGDTDIDLSNAVLRSISPWHRKYLLDMGVSASMSVSIVSDAALWGLVICHHSTPYFVDAERRKACVLLAQLVGWQLTLQAPAKAAQSRAEVANLQTHLLQQILAGQNYAEALQDSPGLLDLPRASGFAMNHGDMLIRLGVTPPEAEIARLVDWLVERGCDLFETDQLAHFYRPAAQLAGTAAGLIALPLGGDPKDMVMWFRPEAARLVDWAGDPQKAHVANQQEPSPRRSFAPWSETVRLRARAWESHDLVAASGLREVIVGLLLRRTVALESLNAKLRHSNEELEAFARVASHDLQEPLRRIETFTTLLARSINDPKSSATDAGRWFEGIKASSRRLRGLIKDLAEYARIGRTPQRFVPADLRDLFDQATNDLGHAIEEAAARIEVGTLPVIPCDPVQMRQVLQNLIENAVKYRKPGRTLVIRVGAALRDRGQGGGGGAWVIEIADNGIGFEQRHRDFIFEPFQRLHSADAYAGSGIGLAICRKIIERHHGTITAEGRPGEGASFRITLPNHRPGE